jgi:hypothetical protein
MMEIIIMMMIHAGPFNGRAPLCTVEVEFVDADLRVTRDRRCRAYRFIVGTYIYKVVRRQIL